MEISPVSKNLLKIKGKKATFLLTLDGKSDKTEADAIISLANALSLEKVSSSSTILLNEPGDYEVAGVKMSAIKSGDELLYQLRIDNLLVIVSTTTAVGKLKEKVTECQVMVLFAKGEIEQSAIVNAQPSLVVLYGDDAVKVAGMFEKKGEGAEGAPQVVKSVSKISVTSDKLPTEMQVVSLE